MFEWSIDTSSVSGNNDFSLGYSDCKRGFCKIIADSVGRPSRPLTAEYLERSLLDSVAENIPKHTKLQERLFEIVGRLGALFGSGWFFEWPGGKLLWGVCWMFVIAHPYNIGGRGYSPGNSLSRNQNGAGSRGRPQQRSADNYYLTPPVALTRAFRDPHL
ncbi:hypothetical protein M7I_5912 [Glarea lozoyensis 74030]|uniref:Uncharacterized protein n=1 Tax=Glarea lozoyensis (strain ATCC 74030 / MF5533) TaxID=1104152 RepID=H0ET57_GLAL7|nr:hypothetical protein M7I_5912 [Glarea lozoyensis 74030]